MSRKNEGTEEWSKISNKAVYDSWGGQRNFMASYGLKEYEAADYDVSNQIRDGIKQGMWDSMSATERDGVRAQGCLRQ